MFRFGYSSHALLQNAAQGEEIPRYLSGFRVTVRWQDLTRTSFQKEIDKAVILLNWSIVNDVKKGTIRFPFALVPEAALARNVSCDAGASYPTYSDYSDYSATYCELIFQLAHYQRGVGAAEAEAVRHNGGQFAIGRFGHDVQTCSLLVQLFNVDVGDKPCSSISRE
ncbi:hypothetical protein ACLB1M_18540 [Escherichia coli]